MKTIVSEKGQITIPKPLRVRLGIRKGEVLEVREERGRLVMSKRPSNDPFEKYFGILKLGRRTDEIIDELRGSEKPSPRPLPRRSLAHARSRFLSCLFQTAQAR